MKKVTLGSSNQEVSALCFGTLPFGIAVPGIFSTKCHIFRESGVIICFWVRE